MAGIPPSVPPYPKSPRGLQSPRTPTGDVKVELADDDVNVSSNEAALNRALQRARVISDLTGQAPSSLEKNNFFKGTMKRNMGAHGIEPLKMSSDLVYADKIEVMVSNLGFTDIESAGVAYALALMDTAHGVGKDEFQAKLVSFIDTKRADKKIKKLDSVLEAYPLVEHAYILAIGHLYQPLTTEHAQSFSAFAGCDTPPTVLVKIANHLASRMSKDDMVPILVDLCSSCEWLQYRATYASGMQVVQRAIEAAPTLFTDLEKDLVALAMRHFWDKVTAAQVPHKAIGKAYVVATTMGFCPKNWYQGMKYKDTLPAIAVEEITQALEARAILVAKSIKTLGSVNDVNAILAALQ